MQKSKRLISLLLCIVMVLGMMPTAFAADGAPVPTGDAAAAEWSEIQSIISQYYGEWTEPTYPGAVNNRIPNTALLGNGDVGVSSAGSATEKSFNISKGDFWEYNNSPMKVGDISIGASAEIADDGSNLARQYKTVTTSSGNGKLAVNGRSTAPNDGYSGWVSENQDKNQWLALEFEEAITFNTWTVRSNGYANDRAMNTNTRAAELQTSENGIDWKTVSSFADSGSSVKTVVMDSAVTTKYVRLLVTEPTQPTQGDSFTRIPQFILSMTEVEEAEIQNLALGYKAVSASSEHESLTADRAVSGEWAENQGYEGWTSTVGNPQWLMLEFAEPITFDRWVVRNDAAGRPAETANNTKDCQLEISENGTDWTPVSTVTGNSANVIDVSMGEVTTKWVRLYVTKGTQETTSDSQRNPRARVGAFELYNMPEVVNENLIKAGSYASYKTSTQHESLSAETALDGNFTPGGGYDGWTSAIGNPQWLMVDMGKEVTFNRWVVHNDGSARPAEGANNTSDCQLQIWAGEGAPNGDDASGWTDVDAVVGNTANVIDRSLSENKSARYIRLYITKGTTETTADSRNNPRGRIAAFELYNMADTGEYNTNLVPGYASYKTSTQHESLSAETAVNGSFTLNCGAWGWSSAVGNPQWLMVDMGKEITFNRWVVHNDGAGRPKESQNNTKDCQLEIWTGSGVPTGSETEGWEKVDGVVGNGHNTIDRRLSADATAQYIRLYITKGTQETTGDARSNPRGRVAGFELYNMNTEPSADVNLAVNADIYVCNIHSDNEAAPNMVDGKIETAKWCCTKDCGTHYAILDLKSVYTLNASVLIHSGLVGEHNHNTGAYEIQYLETAEDMTEAELKAATGWKTAATVTGNTGDQTIDDLGGINARYVRLWLTQPAQGNSASRIHEWEIYGLEAVQESTNVIMNKPIYVCDYFVDNGTPWPGTHMIDGKIDNLKWCCVNNETHYAIVDMGVENILTSYKLVNSGQVGEYEHNTHAFKIEYLDAVENMDEAALKAATGWKTAVEVTDNTATVVEGEVPSGISARYVRLWLTDPTVGSNGAARIHEWELYGYEGSVGGSGDDEEETPETPEIPAVTPIAFNEKEDILNAQVVTRQHLADTNMEITSWMSATNNLFVMEIKSLEEKDATVSVNLEAHVGSNCPTSAEVGDGYMVSTRSTRANGRTGLEAIYETTPYISKAAMATKVIGAEANFEVQDDALATMTMTLPAGGTVYVVTAIAGGGRTYTADGKLWEGRTEPVEEAVALLNTVETVSDVTSLHDAHLNWWKNYWMQSYISLDTSDADLATLQKYYYAAQYELGSGIREGSIASGLYSIWHTTDTPSWHSDFHLNYNFISTYYGLATSNRTSMLLPAVDALVDYIPQGMKNASSLQQLRAVYSSHIDTLINLGQVDATNGISDAILFPVAIGPYGMTVENNSYHRETINAPMSAYPLIEYYNYTQDKDFMEDTLYAYLKRVANFAEAWFVEENGGYTLYAGYNEGSWAKNAALELGAYKMCLKYAIQIGTELGEDADKLAKWQKIYEGLAEQPMVENYNGTGKTVLSLAEQEYKNGQWVDMATPVPGDGNCLPLETIVPFEVYGYYSSDEDLKILQDTVQIFDQRGGWTQINNFPKLAVNAVNARYDAKTIAAKLAAAVRSHMKKNMMIDDNVHGIEKAGATEAINNMMLLSDKGVIKLFGNWLADKDAKFARLRAAGAFVFSAEYDGEKQEIVEGATMYSEAGATATVASLWEEGMAVYDESGNRVTTTRGTAPNHPDERTYTFDTVAGKTYTFKKFSDTAVTGVSLDKTELTLAAGSEETLIATVVPEGASVPTVSWSSSDENVATVDQTGKVTAVGKGEATITVTTTDGGKTATCAVTVTLDTSAIDTAIAAADTAKADVQIIDGKTAEEVVKGTKFVTSEEMTALTDAVAAASAAKETAKTPAQVTEAVNTLNAAVAAFNNAIKIGGYDQAAIDQAAADAVDAKIDDIGEVTLESSADIAAARAAYDALTDEQKALVDDLADLEAAEAAYAELVAAAEKEAADKAAADAAVEKIQSITNVTLSSKEAIAAARAAYDALTEDQKAKVPADVLDALEEAEAKLEELEKEEENKPGIHVPVTPVQPSKPAVTVKFPFTDVAESAWYYDEVKEAWENDLIDGMTATSFEPNSSLTVAQAIKLAAALHQMDKNGKVTLENGADVWYSTYVSYAMANGIIDETYGDYTWAQMNAAITRREFVHIFYGVNDFYARKNTVADNAIPDVKLDDACADEIYAFYRAGILIGSDDAGTFYPNSNIKRSEVATILIRMYDVSARQSITL